MRALLLNPPMPLAFWSFPRLCRLAGAKTLGPPLGLITVAALLPRDWELRLADLNARPLREDAWQWADLVLVSGMLAQRTSLLRLVREAKARGKTVVAGGPYPTPLPEEVLAAGCDFLVKGEGETAIPLLLQALARGDTGGVIESPTRPDLAISPIPRFDLLHLKDYVAMAVQTSRGCPYDCEFCAVIKLYGRKMRYKEPDQVLAELEVLYRLGWRKEIFICDDNFVGSKSRARAVLRRLLPWLESRGNPFLFWTQASIDLGQDTGLMDLMVRVGFSTVVIGIESPDAAVLAQTRKHHNIRHPLLASLTHLRDPATTGAVKTIDRVIDALPGDMREQTKSFLSQSLIAVITQVLVKTADQRGRKAVCEVMIVTRAIGKLIMTDQTHQIATQLQTGKDLGMQMLDQALLANVQAKEIDPDDAYIYASDKRLFARFVTDMSVLPKLDLAPG